MTAKWMLQTKKADFDAIAGRYRISPVTARIIRNRDVQSEEEIRRYLTGTLDDLYDPHLMKDMDRAVEILKEKIRDQKRIRIVGDYDIDGVCSTYLLYKGLSRVNAAVDYEIPDRIKDGYGINESIIRDAYESGIDTILTCDNGISAISQIALAKELGMTVIITDHHDIAEEDGKELIPQADAVINPKQKSCTYPFSGICGGLVAYKLVQAVYEAYGVPMEEWKDLLEFAAIATVGDVMKLQNENRIIVKYGLMQIRKTGSLGLKKLIEKNDLDPEHISSYHIGFVIGPCLNAGGRLQTAKLALSLLLCQDEEEAGRMAQELKQLNDMRKDMTQQGLAEAVELVDRHYADDKVLVVYLPECHESLAGIIAGRLRERYHKPSFVLTRGEESVKGSGRSIEAYHMFEALLEVKDVLLKFGGHPMAAGLSLEENMVDEFRRRLNENASLTEEDFIEKIWIDVPMPLDYISEPLIKELELLEPFGQGNEKPQFAQKDLNIRSVRVLGRNRNAVKLCLVTGNGTVMDAMLFTDGDEFTAKQAGHRMIDIIYYPTINEYNGNRTLQVTVKDYKLH
ncbi:single-stranded-DNA-specific exonuclease RecJ [Clostridium sp. chh4-2]|uniref:single-stranded-DNA-specific exonuclease RecJ n=1 Tax=Clostridium sp. chh4-2 TaxID=2067550 RepID=UPI000CCE3FDA|nr:single-stranded-DNA-specific exonuclease RecJ [Clostridium sp. chh4-2]PNV59581.1 single-stranded-DNA-specific exonuclease RecJ [Clostridium sp. chh4-2]